MSQANIIGVGVTKFGRHPDRTVESLAAEAVSLAIADAGIEWRRVQQFYAAHVQQGVAAGQRILQQLGPTGIPALNIENCAAAGSTAVREASIAIRAGECDVAVVVGFEKMQHGVLLDVAPEGDPEVAMGMNVVPMRHSLMGMKHMQKYGTRIEHFAQVSVKNHDHAMHNPNAQYPKPVTVEQVLASRMICDPITVLQCCPTTDGAAAVVVCSDAFLAKLGKRRAVRILGAALTSDIDDPAYNEQTMDHVERASRLVYERAGRGPGDLDVVEVHDCFSVAEIVSYEALGLCAEGEGGRLIEEGATRIGGRIPVNTSGGLLAKGHPLGASGVAQICELTTQLRGEAGQRQVSGARTGLACNMGIWSACVTLLAA
jgi:acetyl-CoA acyltransferase